MAGSVIGCHGWWPSPPSHFLSISPVTIRSTSGCDFVSSDLFPAENGPGSPHNAWHCPKTACARVRVVWLVSMVSKWRDFEIVQTSNDFHDQCSPNRSTAEAGSTLRLCVLGAERKWTDWSSTQKTSRPWPDIWIRLYHPTLPRGSQVFGCFFILTQWGWLWCIHSGCAVAYFRTLRCYPIQWLCLYIDQ